MTLTIDKPTKPQAKTTSPLVQESREFGSIAQWHIINGKLVCRWV